MPAGFVILAACMPAELDAWIAGREFARYTQHAITDPAELRASVALARRQGYWLAEQYIDVGLRGLAVALTDRKGRCVGAISMTFQSPVYPCEAALTKLLPALQDVAQVPRRAELG